MSGVGFDGSELDDVREPVERDEERSIGFAGMLVDETPATRAFVAGMIYAASPRAALAALVACDPGELRRLAEEAAHAGEEGS